MATDSIWLARTNRGRVVYESSRRLEDRPHHFFDCSDIDRIVRKVGCGYFNIPMESWERFSDGFNTFVLGFFQDEGFLFGGGEFGGGGASRSSDRHAAGEIMDPPMILILKERSEHG